METAKKKKKKKKKAAGAEVETAKNQFATESVAIFLQDQATNLKGGLDVLSIAAKGGRRLSTAAKDGRLSPPN